MTEFKLRECPEACEQATRQYGEISRTIAELPDPGNVDLLDRRGTPPYAKLHSTKDIPIVLGVHSRRIAAETAWMTASARPMECYDEAETPHEERQWPQSPVRG